jgi:hypothetical protein
LIPEGTVGNVYIIQGIPSGNELEKTQQQTIYKIPESRILIIKDIASSTSAHTAAYFYVGKDGARIRLEEEYSSLHKTEENLKNERPFIWAPRSGTMTIDGVPCEIEYDQFYVGTRRKMLLRTAEQYNDEQLTFQDYVRANAARLCEGKPAVRSPILVKPAN